MAVDDSTGQHLFPSARISKNGMEYDAALDEAIVGTIASVADRWRVLELTGQMKHILTVFAVLPRAQQLVTASLYLKSSDVTGGEIYAARDDYDPLVALASMQAAQVINQWPAFIEIRSLTSLALQEIMPFRDVFAHLRFLSVRKLRLLFIAVRPHDIEYIMNALPALQEMTIRWLANGDPIEIVSQPAPPLPVSPGFPSLHSLDVDAAVFIECPITAFLPLPALTTCVVHVEDHHFHYTDGLHSVKNVKLSLAIPPAAFNQEEYTTEDVRVRLAKLHEVGRLQFDVDIRNASHDAPMARNDQAECVDRYLEALTTDGSLTCPQLRYLGLCGLPFTPAALERFGKLHMSRKGEKNRERDARELVVSVRVRRRFKNQQKRGLTRSYL